MLDSLLVVVRNQKFVSDRLENENPCGDNEQGRHRDSIGKHDEHGGENGCVPSFQWELRIKVGFGIVVLALTTAAAPSEQNFEKRAKIRHHIRENHRCLNHLTVEHKPWGCEIWRHPFSLLHSVHRQ